MTQMTTMKTSRERTMESSSSSHSIRMGTKTGMGITKAIDTSSNHKIKANKIEEANSKEDINLRKVIGANRVPANSLREGASKTRILI